MGYLGKCELLNSHDNKLLCSLMFLNNAENSWNPQGLEHFLSESEKDQTFFLRFHKVFVKRLGFRFLSQIVVQSLLYIILHEDLIVQSIESLFVNLCLLFVRGKKSEA